MVAIGTQLGPYRLLDRLGAGGMGEVFRAQDVRLDREVAVKVLSEKFAEDPERLARFEREAKAVAALAHPNILVLYDIGKEHGVSFAVTELLEGEDLRRTLGGRSLPWRRTLEIGVAVADGLAVAHAKGIIHRDLKPENLFITSDGRVKILDFGLARVEPKPQSDAETTPYLTAQTETGTVLGTVGYMSPEQIRGQTVDARSDIFSLGCVLYEMVAGQRPFKRETAADTTAAILNADPPDLGNLGTQVPNEVERGIRRCLAKRSDERFQSARELAVALQAMLAGSDVSHLIAPTQVHPTLPRPRARKAIDSIAVLPLVNASADPNMEYLSDGISESLINTLSRFPKLRVMARSTVFRYKGRVDVQEVGRELGVRAVLAGRVLQVQDRLIIKMELVDVLDGSQLWGEQYNREVAEIFAVEDAIAREIAEKLKVPLTGKQKQQLAKKQTDNAEAYQHYLKGRFHWNKRIESELKKAIKHFEQAIELDPAFALAYAGLADSYGVLSAWSECLPAEAFPTAKQMATKALELDDSLAEAHTSLAYINVVYEWNWSEAEREYRRAIELNPSYANAHHWYAYLLMVEARFDEARREIERAQELDPLSLIINANVGFVQHFARQYDAAIEQFEKAVAMDARFPSAHYYLGLSYEQKGQYEQSIAEFREAVTLSSGTPGDMGALGHAYASCGKLDEARKVLDELIQLSKRRYVPSFNIGLIYLRLGEIDHAFEWFERAYTERDFYLIYLKVDPRLDSIRGDPRFVELYRRVGLPA